MTPKPLMMQRIETGPGTSQLVPDYRTYGKPWVIQVHPEYLSMVPAHYLRLYTSETYFVEIYCRWQLWPMLRGKYELNSRWWDLLRWCRDRGLIHSSTYPALRTRFRDLRFGRGKVQ